MKKNKHHKNIRKPNKDLQNAVLRFMEDASPHFSRNLRNLLLDYISQNMGCLPIDFDVCLKDFNNLFAFLDVIEDSG